MPHACRPIRPGSTARFVLTLIFALALAFPAAGSLPLVESFASDQLVFSTYLGGEGVDDAAALATDSQGNSYVGGSLRSLGLSATPGSYDTTLGGESDAFVAKFNATGTLEFLTYLGGTGQEGVQDIAIDGSGNVLVCGGTNSADFPTTVDGFARVYSGEGDVFLAKLSGDGTALLDATYLGGSDSDQCAGFALGADGSVYVTGPTFSFDFPTTADAYDPAIVGGLGNFFISRLDVDAGTLVFSTYIEGVWDDASSDIVVDAAGNPIVVGWTDSADFPTTSTAYDATVGGRDGFLLKLNAAGSDVLFGTFLGGSNTDLAIAAEIGPNDVVDVTGYTVSTDFPTTEGALRRSYQGSGVFDAFVLRLDPQGSLVYSTYLGGSGDDSGRAIAIDPSGATVVLGETNSADFPTTSNAISRVHGGFGDTYVVVIDGSGSRLSYSTYFGGSGSDVPADLALDSDGHVYWIGGTDSADLPVTEGAFDPTFNGQQDGFLSRAQVPEPTPSDGPAPFPWILVGASVAGAVIAATFAILLRSKRRRKRAGLSSPEVPRKPSP